MITIKIDDASLQKKLERIIKNSPKVEQEIVEIAGEQAFTRAKNLAPVDTGALRDSITLKVEESEATISSSLEYAAPVEYGTSRQAAQPYMRPAAEEVRKELPKIAKAVLRQYD
jgi:HK97 gp10 family phage protein